MSDFFLLDDPGSQIPAPGSRPTSSVSQPRPSDVPGPAPTWCVGESGALLVQSVPWRYQNLLFSAFDPQMPILLVSPTLCHNYHEHDDDGCIVHYVLVLLAFVPIHGRQARSPPAPRVSLSRPFVSVDVDVQGVASKVCFPRRESRVLSSGAGMAAR